MKKYFPLFGLFQFIALLMLALASPFLPVDTSFLGMDDFQRVGATLENGMTVLLMLSAVYTIGKNFMFQKQVDHLKEKVRNVISSKKLQ